MRLGQRLHTLILELYSYRLKFGLYIGIISFEIMLQIGIMALDWDYGFRLGLWLQIEIRATDWDYSFRLGLQLQIEIRATDWDLGYILGF